MFLDKHIAYDIAFFGKNYTTDKEEKRNLLNIIEGIR